MKRSVFQDLSTWKNQKKRKPLLFRGARQVGKSYLARQLGKTFSEYVEINFELEEDIADIFNGPPNPAQLIEKIRIAKNAQIVPGKTLLFLDEIQNVPKALTSLRYFYEKTPDLHVIAAGSLIDFAIEKVGMPVGRIRSLYLQPLSFIEFLEASGHSRLKKLILHHDITQPLDKTFMNKLTLLLSEYMLTGGMPEAVASWINERNPRKVRDIHNDILDTYRNDFNKYARHQQIFHVEKTFSAVPALSGRKFIYSHVDDSLKSREIKPALSLLEKAGVVHIVRHSSANGVPLLAEADNTFFKTIFLDIGLMQAMLGVDAGSWILKPENTLINRGAAVEALAGQEMLAYGSCFSKQQLFYWVRDKRSGKAEVDYVLEQNENAIPIEVKSGKTGSLKSLTRFLEEKSHTPYGVHVSTRNFGTYGAVRQIPLFALIRLFQSLSV